MKRFFICLVLLLLTACNSYVSKMRRPSESAVNASSISFRFINEKIFEPHCVRCHSLAGGDKGDINLESYENVLASLDLTVETVLNDQSMPPRKAGGPLSAYEQNLLRMWVEAGAPLEAAKEPQPSLPTPSPSVTPEPAPSPPPAEEIPIEAIEPTWQDISEKIFKTKCLQCHVVGEKADGYPLVDKDHVADPENLMVTPGDPENSGLYISVSRTDRYVMPPPKSGPPLSRVEIEAIRLWILNGAKD